LLELLIAVAGLVLTSVVSLVGIREIKRTKEAVFEAIPSLDDYIFQDEESGEWQIDARLGKMFDHVGSRMALSIKQSLFQGMGVQKKIEKGLQSAVIDDVLDSGALGQIGGLADIFLGGRVREYLKQNPSAINALVPLLSGAMGGKGFNLKALMGQQSASSGKKEGDVFSIG
jgi:hypothetical protein